MQYIESQHQQSLFAWARQPLVLKQYPELELLYANRNTQLAKSKAAAVRIKKEGSLAGVPDIFLPVARQGYNGYYIEMKTPDLKPKTERGKRGGLSDEQLIIFPKLITQGYKVKVAYSWTEAKDFLESYLAQHNK